MSASTYEPNEADAAVADAMGIDEDTPDETPAEEGQDGNDERTTADVEAELAEMKRENARLKRENAAARVARKVAPAASGDGKALSQADIDAAEERGKQAATLEAGVRLARAEVKAALKGIIPDAQLPGFIDDLNLSRFVDEEGEVDAEAVKALEARQRVLANRSGRTSVGHAKGGRTPTNKSVGDQFADAISAQLN